MERFEGFDPSLSYVIQYFVVGVTYDTGGADVKVGGHMLGMSRDKCGAAAVIGFMQVVNLLQPKNIRVVAGVGIVRYVYLLPLKLAPNLFLLIHIYRNSIGSNSYVADEVITARSGARVRVINTDAEGRMIMADILCRVRYCCIILSVHREIDPTP